MTNKEKFAEAVRLLDEGDVTAAGDLIIELGPFFRPQMVSQGTNHLSVPHPSQANRCFIVRDEGNGPYLLPEATLDWGEYGKPFRGTPGKRPRWCPYGRTAPCLDSPAIKHYECCECGHHVHRRSPPLGWRPRHDGTYWLCPTCLGKLDDLTKEKTDE